MRITMNTKSLIDVIIINNSNYTKPSQIMDLGLSDHHAEVLTLCIKVLVSRLLKDRKRIFYEGSIEEYKSVSSSTSELGSSRLETPPATQEL
jgi:hypothetical protein